MSRALNVGAALAAALLVVLGAYRLGAGLPPFQPHAMPAVATDAASPTATRKVLYWKDPDGKADFSPAPKKTAQGRDYVPVYDEDEPPLPGVQTAASPAKGKLLYYRNPMGLADTSPVPKKDWMGMDYIPVYEGEQAESSTVKVSLDRVQRAGVRSEPAEMRPLVKAVRAPGVAKPDERTLRSVSLRTDGFIEKVYVNAVGLPVKAGEPMFTVYSPQIVSALIDYQVALRSTSAESRGHAGAMQRLRNLGVPESVLKTLPSAPDLNPDSTRKGLGTMADPHLAITWAAPMTGVVMQKSVVEGQMAKAGEELYRLADLSSIWVIADVAEQDIGLVSIGAPATLSFRAYPGEEFTGRVSFILHELDPATRTGKVRIEVRNVDHRLKHEMYADVVIETGDAAPKLAVPLSAVIDSGRRQIVLVDKGEGRFEPRPVKLGMRSSEFVEVTDGLKAGEAVVVSANFLIDAESNLKAALQAFTAEPPMKEAKP